MRNNRGITLIALVITIIVLLILAGVSIAMLTGDNGILTQATKSRDENNIAEVLERVNMELNAQLANAMAQTAFDTNDKIKSNIGDLPTGYSIQVDSDSTSYATSNSVSITVTGEGISSTAGTVTYSGDKWTVTPVEKTAE